MSSHPTAFRPFGSKFGSKYFSIRLKLVALIQESIDQVVLNDDREQSFNEFGLGGVTATGSPNDRIMDVQCETYKQTLFCPELGHGTLPIKYLGVIVPGV